MNLWTPELLIIYFIHTPTLCPTDLTGKVSVKTVYRVFKCQAYQLKS